MLRAKLNPGTVAVAILVVLGLIQFVFWRLLVYREPMGGTPGGAGGGGPPAKPFAMGLQDVAVETYVGGPPGYRDGPGWEARFSGPNALASLPDGTLIVADSRNHRIRMVTPDGVVSTIAGGGPPGGRGDQADGLSGEARFRFPSGVAVGKDGTLYVSDTGNHRVCALNRGRVSFLAGGGPGRADGRGGAARFHFPAALAPDPEGGIWVADAGNHALRRVAPDGQVTTPAAVPAAVKATLGDWSAKPGKTPVTAVENGLGPWEATSFSVGRRSPAASVGGLYVFADPEFHVLLGQRAAGPVMLLAGRRLTDELMIGTDDGAGTRVTFARVCAAAAGPDGTVYLAEYEGNRIRRVRLPDWLRSGEAPPERRRRWRRLGGPASYDGEGRTRFGR